jgi:hypothetical protein
VEIQQLIDQHKTLQRRRMLVLGDSLAIPRPHKGQYIEETWPVLLSDAFPSLDVWQRCRPGPVCADIVKEFRCFRDSLEFFDCLVLQVGITDCCPRPFPRFVQNLIDYTGSLSLRNKVNSWYPFLLKLRAKPWTRLDDFKSHLESMIETTLRNSPDTRVIVLAIGEPCHDLSKKIPHVGEYRERFNDAIIEVCSGYPETAARFLDPYKSHSLDQIFLDDGHHLTKRGHALVAECIAEALKQAYPDL